MIDPAHVHPNGEPPLESQGPRGLKRNSPPTEPDLELREAGLGLREIELAFDDAQLRGRERLVAAHRHALEDRARELESREQGLREEARRRGVLAVAVAEGLTGTGAMAEVDVEGQMARSATLHLGREAMVAVREETLLRRRRQVDARAEEVIAYEEAFARAEVRLAARERLAARAAAAIEQHLACGTDAPTLPSADAATVLAQAERAGQAPALQPNAAQTESSSFFPVLFEPTDGLPVHAALLKPSEPRLQSGVTLDAGPTTPMLLPLPHPSRPGGTAPGWRPPGMRARPPTASESMATGERSVRHSDTITIEPAVADALDGDVVPATFRETVPRRPGRSTPAPSLRTNDAPRPAMPHDLPDAPPPPRPRGRHLTSPFLAILSLGGHPVVRHQVEVDRAGQTVLVSFPGSAPALGTTPELRFRSREGDEQIFPVTLRRSLADPPHGVVLVLAAHWSPEQYDDFDRTLLQLP